MGLNDLPAFAVACNATGDSRKRPNEYFKKNRTRWGYALREVFSELPDPNW